MLKQTLSLNCIYIGTHVSGNGPYGLGRRAQLELFNDDCSTNDDSDFNWRGTRRARQARENKLSYNWSCSVGGTCM